MFSLAVERGLRLTRLYEYYVETMDTSVRIELPKALLMYFTYNSDSISDSREPSSIPVSLQTRKK